MKSGFNYLNPITDPEYLWGRDSDLTKVFSRINADRPQSVSIVGGHKIGKTSFINVFYSPAIRKKYLDNPESYYFIKLKVNEDSEKNVTEFFRTLGSHLKTIPLSDKIDCDPDDGYGFLLKFIQMNMEEGKKIIFIFDDFHIITSNPDFPLEFFSFLRSMANSYNVAYITSSRLELQKLCTTKDIEESPFFNIFSNYNLRLLSKDHVMKPFSEITGSIEFSGDTEGLLWQNTHHHPYVLQIIGSLLLENEAGSIKRKAQQQLESFFDMIWNDLGDTEKRAVRILASGKPLPRPMIHIVRELSKRSILMEENDKWSFFTPLFKEYIEDGYAKKFGFFKRLLSKRS